MKLNNDTTQRMVLDIVLVIVLWGYLGLSMNDAAGYVFAVAFITLLRDAKDWIIEKW